MLPDTDLKANLQALDQQYQATTSSRDAYFYCKLALIELGGWTEQAMDLLISECSSRNLLEPANKQLCAEKIIGTTYGFEYKKHFRAMMMQLVGLVHVEEIEKQADAGKLARLQSALSTLKGLRDPAAHTHISGTTQHWNAPSFIIGQSAAIIDGLAEIERVLTVVGF